MKKIVIEKKLTNGYLNYVQLVTLSYLHSYTICRIMYTAEQLLNTIYFTFKFHDTFRQQSLTHSLTAALD